MTMLPNLSGLPRFPLSIILSYLQQPSYANSNSNLDSNDVANKAPPLPHNRDALALLLTTKRLAYAILPLFRVPKHICRNYQYLTKDGTYVAVIEKYRFVVLPILDPRTLLDRLNTRRLSGRMAWVKKSNEVQHLERCKEEETDDGVEINVNNHSHTNKNDQNAQDKLHEICYQYGRTIEELAFEEWVMMEINHADGTVKENGNKWRMWPAHLELLRFLDDDDDDSASKDCPKKMDRKRRTIPSPFCFRASSNRQRKNEIESPMADNKGGGQIMFGNGVSLLASYPRSGNTLLRTLLERITSTVTGSDTRPDRTLSKSLALDHDLVGEGLVGPNNKTNTKSKSSLHLQNLYQSAYDPLVHIVKTHFPERKGWKPVKGNRVLLLVRNPYDAIDSYWNLCCTNTHTRSLEESVYTKFAKKFEGLARHEIQVWCEFHYYWMDICEKEGVPLLIVRYEDLVLDIEAEMMRVMKFLMGQQGGAEDKMASFLEWRIRHAVGKSTTRPSATKPTQSTESEPATQKDQVGTTNTSNLGSYQPRSSSGGLLSIGKSIRKKRYSERALWHMHEIAVSLELARKQNQNNNLATTSDRKQPNQTLLQRFGYDMYTQQFPDNFKQPTAIASCGGSGTRKGTVAINKTAEIRKKDDPFGRAMTHWRRGETDADTKPFPTIPR
mmetsp:Transcript_18342/g.39648  ORF Transcript_18342/g.39648 Transcript_18342/m.39648 type:complete len:668 (-) Transcript_18342:82-2085(-)